jgi:hypothetical protein
VKQEEKVLQKKGKAVYIAGHPFIEFANGIPSGALSRDSCIENAQKSMKKYGFSSPSCTAAQLAAC